MNTGPPALPEPCEEPLRCAHSGTPSSPRAEPEAPGGARIPGKAGQAWSRAQVLPHPLPPSNQPCAEGSFTSELKEGSSDGESQPETKPPTLHLQPFHLPDMEDNKGVGGNPAASPVGMQPLHHRNSVRLNFFPRRQRSPAQGRWATPRCRGKKEGKPLH